MHAVWQWHASASAKCMQATAGEEAEPGDGIAMDSNAAEATAQWLAHLVFLA